MAVDIFGAIAQHRVVPVVEITGVDRAVPLADALDRAGLPIMEVTLRTPDALDAIRAIRQARPEFLVGAGTLLTPSQVEGAADAGALFGVSPGFTPALSQAAGGSALPFIPGAVTASEALTAAEHGHTHLKFFPAEAAGGAALIGSLMAPLAGLGVSFMPTGGIRLGNIGDYLSLANVASVGGTWIAPRNAIASGDFIAIEQAAREAVTRVAE